MARFFARFDGGAEGDLEPNADYFVRLRVGASSASAALLRDGLIASRSLLSSDVYEDLDGVNQSGANGTYFPLDTPTPFTTNYSTFASWSSAYTSSIEGIKTPTSNDYGTGNVNYSKRPTASVSATASGVVQSNPVDPVGVSYATYFSASNAVRTVLNTIQSSGHTSTNIPTGESVTPFNFAARNISSPSPDRTIHSVWSDPGLNYFAWDDFAPGTASILQILDPGMVDSNCNDIYIYLGTPTISLDLNIISSLNTFQFISDTNPAMKIGFKMLLQSSSGQQFNLDVGYSDYNQAFSFGTTTSSYGPIGPRTSVASTWEWDAGARDITWTIGLPASSYDFLQTQFVFYDVKIPTNLSTMTRTRLGSVCNGSAFSIREGEPQ